MRRNPSPSSAYATATETRPYRRRSGGFEHTTMPRLPRHRAEAKLAVSLKQVVAVGSYVVRQRIAGQERYPLVLTPERLFRCTLACGCCGKIQHPVDVLRRHLTPEQCFAAVEDCG